MPEWQPSEDCTDLKHVYTENVIISHYIACVLVCEYIVFSFLNDLINYSSIVHLPELAHNRPFCAEYQKDIRRNSQ
jgi:hypothetical protein